MERAPERTKEKTDEKIKEKTKEKIIEKTNKKITEKITEEIKKETGRAETVRADVAVIGGGPGGVAAAVAAARAGAHVLLVERGGYLGGQLGSGLPFLAFLDRKGRQVVAGIAQEMVDRLAELGGTKGHAPCPFHLSTTMVHPFYSRIVCFEMAKEAGVELLLHCELAEVQTENVSGKKRIRSVAVVGKGTHIEIEADIFIDATGDGDLGFLAGAAYEKGQKDTGVMQPPTLMFNLAGIDFERFCSYIENHPEELPYSLGLPNLKAGYDAEFFRTNPSFTFFGMNHMIERLKKEGRCPVERDTVIFMRQAIEGEVAVNTTRILHFDGSSIRDLSRGEMEAHLQIPRIIRMFREEIPGFEHCYLTSINSSIGVRESRRLCGKKMLNHEDALAGRVPEDTIALCGYFMDIHNGDGEDTISRSVEEPFGIPYLCLVSDSVENLMMSGRCISVDAVTFGATRVMNTCMAVGQAAGTAAAAACAGHSLPEQVDTRLLRARLLEQGAVLSL